MKKYILMLTTLVMLGSCAVQESDESDEKSEWLSLVGGKTVICNNTVAVGAFSVDGETFTIGPTKYELIEYTANSASYKSLIYNAPYMFKNVTDGGGDFSQGGSSWNNFTWK